MNSTLGSRGKGIYADYGRPAFPTQGLNCKSSASPDQDGRTGRPAGLPRLDKVAGPATDRLEADELLALGAAAELQLFALLLAGAQRHDQPPALR